MFTSQCFAGQLNYCAAEAIMVVAGLANAYAAAQTGGTSLLVILLGLVSTIAYDATGFYLDTVDTNDVPHG